MQINYLLKHQSYVRDTIIATDDLQTGYPLKLIRPQESLMFLFLLPRWKRTMTEWLPLSGSYPNDREGFHSALKRYLTLFVCSAGSTYSWGHFPARWLVAQQVYRPSASCHLGELLKAHVKGVDRESACVHRSRNA